MAEEMRDKLQELQRLEQRLQGIGEQQEATESEIVEVESALDELEGRDSAYKIVGNIMVEKDPERLEEELDERRGDLEERFESLKAEHEDVEGDAEGLRQELMESMQ